MSDCIVTLTIDDCWKPHATKFRDIFERNHLKGVFYVISDFVGKEIGGFTFVDWNDLRSMVASGHEIGSHSCTHRGAGLSKLQKMLRFLHQANNDGLVRTSSRTTYAMKGPKDEYNVNHLSPQDEVSLSKKKIQAELAIECKSYSYPGGGYTNKLQELVRSAGYLSARTGLSGFNSQRDYDRYGLKVKSWDQTVTLDVANSWVDKAVREKLWLIEVFHAIDMQNYMYSCSQDILGRHLAYITSHADRIRNLTVSEVL